MSLLRVSPSVVLGIGTLATVIGLGLVAYTVRQLRIGTSARTTVRQPWWWFNLLGGLAVVAAGVAAIVYQAMDMFQRV